MVGDSDLDLVSEKLKLVSISDEEEKEREVVGFEKSDEEFARSLQVFRDFYKVFSFTCFFR